MNRSLLLLSLILALSACRGPSALARLEEKRNTVERQEQSRFGVWKPAGVGSEFLVGDSVRTRARSTAELRLDDGSGLHLEETTLLRFLEHNPGSSAPRIDLEIGGAVLSAGEETLSIEAAFGMAVVAKRGRIRIVSSPTGARFEVIIGSAELATRQGSVRLIEGQPIDVDSTGRIAKHEVEAPAVQASITAPPQPEKNGILAEVTGRGVELRRAGEKDWHDLEPGMNSLPPGALLRLPIDTVVDVRRRHERATLRGPGEFKLGSEERPLVEAKLGSGGLEAHDEPVTLTVPGGTIVVDRNSRADLALEERGVRVIVQQGTVSLIGRRERADLRAGEQAKLEREGSVQNLRRYGPAGADVIVTSDSSFIVHDPEPPTIVGFAVDGRCPGAAVAELDQGRGSLPATLGIGSVNVPIPPGAHEYSVRCAAENADRDPILRGKIVVLRDAGGPRLQKTPTDTSIDADGRRYTLLYQSRMPRITLRWPGAPAAPSFQVSVRSENGGVRRFPAAGPFYSFDPGMLPEGEHVVTFEGGIQRSRPTTLAIRFDNAAPMASVVSPANRSFRSGQRVLVMGTAVPGWQVTVGGHPIALDAAFRFSAETTAPLVQRALVILLQHPQRGTHYYLRRSAAASGT